MGGNASIAQDEGTARAPLEGRDIAWHARDCLRQQAQAVAHLAAQVDDASFEAAARILEGTEGHVIVVGIGKSGHVARKLASTFASTGTPALFLHAGEALHGELGVVTGRDTVLFVSYSGQTDEVLRLLPFVRFVGARTIALVGALGSRLARQVEVALDVSVPREVCPHNLAPTTSAVASLAMGNALAVVLMRAREFGREDFGRVHPAGSRGEDATPVALAMQTRGVLSVPPFTLAADAVLSLVERGAPLALVCDGEQLLGVLTAEDVRRAGPEAMHRPVCESMNRAPATIRAHESVATAERRLAQESVPALVVLDRVDGVSGVYLPSRVP